MRAPALLSSRRFNRAATNQRYVCVVLQKCPRVSGLRAPAVTTQLSRGSFSAALGVAVPEAFAGRSGNVHHMHQPLCALPRRSQTPLNCLCLLRHFAPPSRHFKIRFLRRQISRHLSGILALLGLPPTFLRSIGHNRKPAVPTHACCLHSSDRCGTRHSRDRSSDRCRAVGSGPASLCSSP